MEAICYKNNFLTEVLVKVDFLNPIKELNDTLSRDFSDALQKLFPIVDSKEVPTNNITFDQGGLSTSVSSFKEWQLWDVTRKKRLILTEGFMSYTLLSYESFEEFQNEFTQILTEFGKSYPDLRYKRHGLRYINNISLNEDQPLDWSDYINDDLTSPMNIISEKEKIIRSLGNLELSFPTHTLRFTYGIYNPDYPAKVKNKGFVLDLDASFQGVQMEREILASMPIFHSDIQEVFELSIKNNLRTNYLNNE